MLDTVIIVLRETLEASLLVSFLFVYSNYFVVDKKWMFWALLIGGGLSFVIALEMSNISDLFGGLGQELLFVIVLVSISLLIQWANALVILSGYVSLKKNAVKLIYAIIIILAISMEGAEIIIFSQSNFNKDAIYSHLLGSILGLGIGVSVGAVSYYVLSQASKVGVNACVFLLTLLSAGMISQAIAYLAQVDLISADYPVWDSRFIIGEQSIFGHLLYALIGYEATPVLEQVVFYCLYLLIPALIVFYNKIRGNS